MASACSSGEELTSRHIVRLAAVISADNMAAIAEGYMDISDETIKNKKYENKDSAEAFNREILKNWLNRNSSPNQAQVCKPIFFIRNKKRIRSNKMIFVYIPYFVSLLMEQF